MADMDSTKEIPNDIQKLHERISELEQKIRERTEQFAESERFAEEVAASNPGVTYIFDVDTQLPVHVSGNALQLTGYTAEEILSMGGRVLEQLVPPDELPVLLQQIEALKAVADDVVLSSEARIRRRDGTCRWAYRFSKVFRRGPDGSVKQTVGTLIDITELKKSEEALRRERDRAQGYLDLAGVMFVAIASDETVWIANRKCCDVLGYPEGEIVGRNWFDFFIPEGIRDRIRETFGRLIRGDIEPVEYYENPVLTKSGEERIIAWRNTVIRDSSGEITATLSSGEDITERKKAEVELQAAFSEIRQLKEQLEADNILLRGEVEMARGHETVVGQSSALKSVMGRAERVAATDSTVLILGETGTGKELIARAIHDLSARRERPFVAVNCAAVPSTLVESELFGREKGAYTGALTKQIGRFEAADGSTVFLDEVAELSAEAQAKLLRVLEEGQFERLGSTETIKVDIRLIAATNRDLAKAVEESGFRSDLYYRLNVFPISVPPLRERREDIPSLVWHFVNEFNSRMGRRVENISQRTMGNLQSYSWPGNIRELRNVIEHAMILTTDSTLRIQMPEAIAAAAPEFQTLEESQRRHIRAVLDQTGWRVRGRNGAAEILGLKPSTLESKMAKLGIRRMETFPR